MIFLSKTIHQVFLVDFFTEEERIQNKVTLTLCNFLNRNGVITTCLYPTSDAELLAGLQSILNQELRQGIIIHFIGHGDNSGVGFGNSQYFLKWEDIYSPLADVNAATNDGLIVNSAFMCYGENIFRLAKQAPKPFYAAIGSKTERSLQALDHNIQLYKRCLTKDLVEPTLQMINDILQDNQGLKGYELRIT